MVSMFASATVALCCASVSAQITYSSRATFEERFPSLALEDFEGIAPPGGALSTPTFTDFTVESGTDGGTSYGVTTTLGTPSDVLFQFNADDRLIFEFGVPVNAVGFNVSSVDFFDAFLSGDAVVETFDSSDNLITSTTISTLSKSSMSTFFGVTSTTTIARLEVGDAPLFAGFIVLDDLQYGVPTPATGALLAIGGLVFSRRRR